jgi:hypothetical protein
MSSQELEGDDTSNGFLADTVDFDEPARVYTVLGNHNGTEKREQSGEEDQRRGVDVVPSFIAL